MDAPVARPVWKSNSAPARRVTLAVRQNRLDPGLNRGQERVRTRSGLRFGNDERSQRFLKRGCGGDHAGCIRCSDRGSGQPSPQKCSTIPSCVKCVLSAECGTAFGNQEGRKAAGVCTPTCERFFDMNLVWQIGSTEQISMTTSSHQLKLLIYNAVDEQPVRLDVTFSIALPVPNQCMISMTFLEWLLSNKCLNDRL